MTFARVAGALLLVVLSSLTACGGNDGSPSREELAARIPANDFGSVVAIDLAAAREALGLPEDFDPAEGFERGGDAGRRLLFDAGAAMPHLASPRELPITEALDHSRITAAATSGFFGEAAVTVIATEQPFAEIAESLESAGFERDGEVLETDVPSFQVIYKAVAGADGVVALADTRDAAEAALEDPEEEERPELELLEEAGGVAAGAYASPRASDCVAGIAIADDGTDGRGELLIEVGAEEPSPRGLVIDDAPGAKGFSPFSAFEFSEPAVEGDLLRAPFTYPLAETGGPIGALAGDTPAGSIYTCGRPVRPRSSARPGA